MYRERRALRRHLMLKCSYSAEARIVNISIHGCLIETLATPRLGELVEFTAELSGRPAILRGVVVHTASGRGFGIRFVGLDEDVVTRVRIVATS
jgi:PilZ domain-containing protein